MGLLAVLGAIFLALIILWIVGLALSWGGWVWVLLVLAILALLLGAGLRGRSRV